MRTQFDRDRRCHLDVLELSAALVAGTAEHFAATSVPPLRASDCAIMVDFIREALAPVPPSPAPTAAAAASPGPSPPKAPDDPLSPPHAGTGVTRSTRAAVSSPAAGSVSSHNVINSALELALRLLVDPHHGPRAAAALGPLLMAPHLLASPRVDVRANAMRAVALLANATSWPALRTWEQQAATVAAAAGIPACGLVEAVVTSAGLRLPGTGRVRPPGAPRTPAAADPLQMGAAALLAGILFAALLPGAGALAEPSRLDALLEAEKCAAADEADAARDLAGAGAPPPQPRGGSEGGAEVESEERSERDGAETGVPRDVGGEGESSEGAGRDGDAAASLAVTAADDGVSSSGGADEGGGGGGDDDWPSATAADDEAASETTGAGASEACAPGSGAGDASGGAEESPLMNEADMEAAVPPTADDEAGYSTAPESGIRADSKGSLTTPHSPTAAAGAPEVDASFGAPGDAVTPLPTEPSTSELSRDGAAPSPGGTRACIVGTTSRATTTTPALKASSEALAPGDILVVLARVVSAGMAHAAARAATMALAGAQHVIQTWAGIAASEEDLRAGASGEESSVCRSRCSEIGCARCASLQVLRRHIIPPLPPSPFTHGIGMGK